MSAMKGQIGMMRHIAGLIFLGLLVSVPCAEAQQQEPQQPAPAPSEPKDTDAKKRQGRQRKRQAGSDGWEEQVGKRNGNRQQIESLKFCRTTDTP